MTRAYLRQVLAQRSRLAGDIAVLLVFTAHMSACDGGSDATAPPETGELLVITSTEGPTPDQDGYAVSLNGGTPVTVGLNDTLGLSGLAPDRHTLVLSGVAENCTVSGGANREVEIVAGRAIEITFEVTCAELPTMLEVSVQTSGIGWDLDGYVLSLDGVEEASVTVSARLVFPDLAEGDHTLELAGLADNCAVQGQHPRTATVVRGSTVTVELEVRCFVPHRIVFSAFVLDAHWRIYLINSDGTGLQALTSGSRDEAPVWSPSGDRIAFLSATATGTAIMVMNSDGTGATPIFTAQEPSSRPTWSPDGTKLAFLAIPSDDPEVLDHDVYVINSDGSGLTLLSREGDINGGPVWSPDGTKIAFTADPEGEEAQPDIYLVDPDGTDLTRLTTAGGFEGDAAWSPDGGTIAFASTGDVLDGPRRLHLMNPDGTNQRVLTAGPYDYAPRWSPDGSRLLFNRALAGQGSADEVFIIDADGTNEANLTSDSRNTGFGEWSPDGRAIKYGGTVGGIGLMNPDGSGKTDLPLEAFYFIGDSDWEP